MAAPHPVCDTFVSVASQCIMIAPQRSSHVSVRSTFGFVQKLYQNGTHYWFEQQLKFIQGTCTDMPGDTPLEVDRYEMSSLAAMQLAFIVTAFAFGVYHCGAMQWLIHRVKERPLATNTAAKLPLVSSVMRSLNNAAFRPLLLAWALDGLALAALVTTFPFYVRYVVNPDGLKAEAQGNAVNPQVGFGDC